MHSVDLILTITGGLAAAMILGCITHRMRLSPIVGYLMAGLIVGPYTPGFVADRPLAEQLAESGVILLMFGVGLLLASAAGWTPMRDAFAVLFFVSVGMLLDPSRLPETPGLLLATLAVVVIGRPLARSPSPRSLAIRSRWA